MRLIVLSALVFSLPACQQAQGNPPTADSLASPTVVTPVVQDSVAAPVASTPTNEQTLAPGEVPRFEDYPSTETKNGRRATLRLKGDEATYRTRIGEVATQPVNFAGIYSVDLWGCGAMCLMGVGVSYNTGEVLYLPGSICCSKREDDWMEVRADSRLIRLSGLVNQEGLNGDHYYVLEGTIFRHLLTIPGPTIDPDALPETSRVYRSLPDGPSGTVRGTYQGEMGEPFAGTIYFKDVQTGDVFTTRSEGQTPVFETTLPVGHYVAFAYSDAGQMGSMLSTYNVMDRESGWGWGWELAVFEVKAGGVKEGVNPSNFTGDADIPKPD